MRQASLVGFDTIIASGIDENLDSQLLHAKKNTYTLAQVCQRLSSGKSITAADIQDSGEYPVYGANGVRGYTSVSNFKGECAIIGRQGAYCGNVHYFSGEAYMSEHAVVAHPNELADARYLAYLLSLMDLSRLQGQSAQPGLSVQTLAKQNIQLPDIATQQRIGNLLGVLDKKIELNRQLNDNLEAMAQALYDYWFVQFDFPDENGKPYKSSGGKMVWNEVLKREIPEGWTNSTVQDYIKIGNGKDHKSVGSGEIPCYGSGGFMFGVAKAIYTGESVLLPRKGSLNNVMLVDGSFWTVDTMFYSEPKMKGAAKYVYYGIQVYDLASMNLGTGVPSMTSTRLYSLKLVGAPYTILAKFDVVVSPLLSKARSLLAENKVLAAQRDFLLPLLMNGQVQVKPLNYRLYPLLVT